MLETESLSRSLLAQARTGDQAARGELLSLYRHYLKIVAGTQVDKFLRVRCDASDLVQETLLEALRDFPKFVGSTEAELVAWLRRILARNLADQIRHHRSQVRDWQRQESLNDWL